jgi:hypothetical protein
VRGFGRKLCAFLEKFSEKKWKLHDKRKTSKALAIAVSGKKDEGQIVWGTLLLTQRLFKFGEAFLGGPLWPPAKGVTITRFA